MALLDQRNGGKGFFFESDFTNGKKGIPINGLIWMGRQEKMLEQIKDKLQHGFSCIKIKVGAINFDEEVSLLKFIRQKFPKDVIEIRLDANGAFTNKNVFENLETLSAFDIHSIEQPVKDGQFELMKKICSSSPIPIALDEELIGVKYDNQLKLLQFISPQYIILKPSLLGGFESANRWITFAEQEKIKWWATSALESNTGLSAIAQWVATKNNSLMQGLGTGSLYSNNMPSSLQIRNGYLWMR
jgi:L-alanine-DL-glutamate epimerase-like enolase superfamily enzyme